jgi:dephospho-CoA kinase
MTRAVKVIGLTGNIATGKSVIRCMLANSGALGIDSDDIAHRMLYPDAPAYPSVIDAFGEQILLPNGAISRRKLGEIVFNDQDKLIELEKLIHPWVTKAVEKRIHESITPIVVVEAIKLFESNLKGLCDTIWVSHVPEHLQMQRLQQTRNLSPSQAKARITAQPPQSDKLANADRVISTESTFKDTWKSTQKALNDTIQIDHNLAVTHFNNSNGWRINPMGTMGSKAMIELWKDLTHFTAQELFKHLGTQMILPLIKNERERCKSLILWRNWDFSASISTIFPQPIPDNNTLALLTAFQYHAQINQSEVLFLPDQLLSEDFDLENLGYSKRSIVDLSYPSWQMAANKQPQANKTKTWVKIISQPIEIEAHLI